MGTTDFIMITCTSKYASTYLNSRGEKAQNVTSSKYKEVCYQLVREGSRLFLGKGTCEWVY